VYGGVADFDESVARFWGDEIVMA